MREPFIAIVLCWFVADAVMMTTPYGSTTPPRPTIVTVMVCQPKDHDRIVPGMIIPRLVTTERIVAASIPPSVQAAEQRKRKR